MALTLRSHLVTAVCCAATLLATGTAPVVAQPVGPSPAEQVRRDTAAIRDIGVSGVQARMIGADARQSVATSDTGDLRTMRPVSAAGYFRMAGTSKTMVATVVLQLEAEGRLSLDDTVDDWLPGVVDGNGNDGRRISSATCSSTPVASATPCRGTPRRRSTTSSATPSTNPSS
ncbi:serine hydrolase [Streptomyces globisporus]